MLSQLQINLLIFVSIDVAMLPSVKKMFRNVPKCSECLTDVTTLPMILFGGCSAPPHFSPDTNVQYALIMQIDFTKVSAHTRRNHAGTTAACRLCVCLNDVCYSGMPGCFSRSLRRALARSTS